MGDPVLESPTDDHTDRVLIEVGDVGGGFDDTAGEEAGALVDQVGGGEGVGEDEVVQTGDTTESIQRDGTDFSEMSA